MYLCKF